MHKGLREPATQQVAFDRWQYRQEQKSKVKGTVKTMAAPVKQAVGGIQFLNTKNIEVPWLQVFIMGDMGSGKTKLASTFPRPVFLVPVNEQSMLTLRGFDFPYLEIDSMHGALKGSRGGMLSAISELEKMYLKNPAEFPFDTIVVEQLGHYGDIVHRELSKDTYAMDHQLWGLFLGHFMDMQARLRRMEVNLVWTAHTKTEKAGEKSTTLISGANLQGKAATRLPSSCDIVAYCETGTGPVVKYATHFRRYQGFNARTRIPLPPMIENCTYEKIVAHLK